MISLFFSEKSMCVSAKTEDSVYSLAAFHPALRHGNTKAMNKRGRLTRLDASALPLRGSNGIWWLRRAVRI
jgi:hypothetical protein